MIVIARPIIYLCQTTWVHRNIKNIKTKTNTQLTQTQSQTLTPWCKPIHIMDQRHNRVTMNPMGSNECNFMQFAQL